MRIKVVVSLLLLLGVVSTDVQAVCESVWSRHSWNGYCLVCRYTACCIEAGPCWEMEECWECGGGTRVRLSPSEPPLSLPSPRMGTLALAVVGMPRAALSMPSLTLALLPANEFDAQLDRAWELAEKPGNKVSEVWWRRKNTGICSSEAHMASSL